MTNAVVTTGPLTKEVAEKVEKFRFVMLDESGKVKHADGKGLPYGYVQQPAAPKGKHKDQDVSYGLPHMVAVVEHQAVVDVEIDADGDHLEMESEGPKFKPGALVYVGKDGKATAKKGTGPAVGLVERAEANGRVRVNMFHSAALAAKSEL